MDNRDFLQALVAVLFPRLLEYLKQSDAPWLAWINKETKWLNRILSPVVAFLVTIGLHFGSISLANGSTMYGVIIPQGDVWIHAISQWLAHEVHYVSFIQGPAAQKQILDLVRDVQTKLGNGAQG